MKGFLRRAIAFLLAMVLMVGGWQGEARADQTTIYNQYDLNGLPIGFLACNGVIPFVKKVDLSIDTNNKYRLRDVQAPLLIYTGNQSWPWDLGFKGDDKTTFTNWVGFVNTGGFPSASMKNGLSITTNLGKIPFVAKNGNGGMARIISVDCPADRTKWSSSPFPSYDPTTEGPIIPLTLFYRLLRVL
jgi:hypothetical protein